METIKNIIYAGVGLASKTSDKIKETINDLVEKGKISDTEGKKIMDNIFQSTESTREDIESKIKTVSDKITSKFDFSKKETNEVLALRKRIEELESQLKPKATKKPTEKKAPVKKAPAKKVVAKTTKAVATAKKAVAKKAPVKATAKKTTTKK